MKWQADSSLKLHARESDYTESAFQILVMVIMLSWTIYIIWSRIVQYTRALLLMHGPL